MCEGRGEAQSPSMSAGAERQHDLLAKRRSAKISTSAPSAHAHLGGADSDTHAQRSSSLCAAGECNFSSSSLAAVPSIELHGNADSSECAPPRTPAKRKRSSPSIFVDDACLGLSAELMSLPSCKRCQAKEAEEITKKNQRALDLMLSDNWSPSPSNSATPSPPSSARLSSPDMQACLHAARDAFKEVVLNLSRQYDVHSSTFALSIAILDKFFEVRAAALMDLFAGEDTHEIIRKTEDAFPEEVPVACFLIASKFREWSSPRIADLARLQGRQCTPAAIRAAEELILATLNWDVDLLTAMDVLERLLSFAPRVVAELLRPTADKYAELAYCAREVADLGPGVVAISALRLAKEELGLGDTALDFVPYSRAVPQARAEACAAILHGYVERHAQEASREVPHARGSDAHSAAV